MHTALHILYAPALYKHRLRDKWRKNGWPTYLLYSDDVVWSKYWSTLTNFFSWHMLRSCHSVVVCHSCVVAAFSSNSMAAQHGGQLSVLLVLKPTVFLLCMGWCHCVMVILWSAISVWHYVGCVVKHTTDWTQSPTVLWHTTVQG